MALVDYKNAILNSWKAAQEATTPILVIDQIVAYGEDTSGGVVWLSDFQNITWNTAANGVMSMANANILLDINQAGTLYGFKIISNAGLAGSPVLEDAATTGIEIDVTNKNVGIDDFIKVTDSILGIGD